jgi:aspartate/methionine/tyrosine aminotransferase
LRPLDFRLVEWILGLTPEAKYNLTSSGLSEPSLPAMGIDTDFSHFASEKDEHQSLFAEAVADAYRVESENVVLTSGASEAIFLVYSVLGTGGRAVVPLPNYEPMFTIPRSLGMVVTNSLERLPAARGAVYGLTDPNNPAAQSIRLELIERLHKASKSNRSVLYVNETYKGFTFPSEPASHFQEYEDVVTCSTMTKFYGLGRLRVGWILADKQRAHRLWNAERLVSGHNPEYSLWIARQVLKKRQQFVRRASEIYTENLALMRRFVEETREAAAISLGDAPFCLVKYRRGPGSVTFGRRLLQKTGVLVSPGDFFGAPKAFRLCFTCNKTILEEGLGLLSDYLRAGAR